MKRYGMRTFTRGYESFDTMIEVDNGDWIRHEDVEKLQAELAAAKDAAKQIANYLVRTHYPKETEFVPLDSLHGILSQISNAVCGWGKDATELSQAKALLKQVFGTSCVSCICKVIDMDGNLYCVFSRELRSQEGRRADCPYLPFEEKK